MGLTSRLAQKTGLSGGLGNEAVKELSLTNGWVQCKWTIHAVLRPEIAAVEFSPDGTTLLSSAVCL